MENTKQNVFINMIWKFAERCGAQIVQFIVTLILARILEPEIYGTVALITVFITIFQVFIDNGLGNALIQKKDADDMDFSTVFYTNIIFSIILYIIIFLISPIIANFYNDETLTIYIRVLGITVLISGMMNIQQAYVAKKMMFKKFFLSTILGIILAAIIGIVMALNGFGIWSLIVQQLTKTVVGTIVLWITVGWKPKMQFSLNRLKSLFSYGWKLLVSALISTLYNDLQQLVIGKKYSTSDLAYYNKANQFPNIIVSNINTTIDSVLLPAMSNVQENKEKIKNMTRKSIKTSIFIMAPLMMGLAFTGENVIELLLTSKWINAVPYLFIFCITYMFYPIHTANLNAIKAMGRSDIFLKLEIIKKTIGIILLLITMNISVMAMAYSLILSCILSQIINAWPNKKLLDYSYLEQIKDVFPSILLAVVMGLIVNMINVINISVVIKLIIQVILGMIIYILGAILFKIDEFFYLFDIVKNIFNRNKEGKINE